MELQQPPLLHRLIPHGKVVRPGMLDFPRALKALGITSIFDLVRLPRSEFVMRLAQYCDDDGEHAYDMAAAYALQLEGLHRQGLGHQPATPNEQAIGTASRGTTYTALFNEDWNTLCAPSSIAAVDGPAAYLRVLYQFALNLEASGKGHRPKITLDERRPDLRALQIDGHSLTGSVSQLSIVSDTLTQQLEIHLAKAPGATRGLSINEALKRQQFPFLLPFDRAHLQCHLCLNEGKPALGELSYRISLKLPLSQAAQNKYGVVFQEAQEAQLLLSALSPSQQALLTDPFKPSYATDSSQRSGFFRQYYGADERALHVLETWLTHTELSADQTQALFARGMLMPKRSANVTTAPASSGARYVNGPSETQASLNLSPSSPAGVRLLNTSFNRFERLHRMVRLQRWLQVPFDELDTLLWSVTCREQQASPLFELNDNSLRAVGVWRYLNRRYTLTVEEFSAILHEIPVDAPPHRLSLFDKVFNASALLQHPLRLDDRPLALKVGDPQQAAIRQSLCAGLSTKDTPDSLHWLMTQSQRHLAPAPGALTLVSSLYRQVRIATLFNLSIRDSHDLAELLAGEAYTRQLVAPTLRASGSNAPPDLLDVLMQMDWLVSWLRHSQRSFADLRRQLLMDEPAQSPKVQERLKHLQTLVDLTDSGLLSQPDIDDLSLPQPEPVTGTPQIRWHAVIVQGLLRSFPLLPEKKALRELPARLVSLIDGLTLSLTAKTDAELKQGAKAALTKKLTALYHQLAPLKERLNSLFSDSAASHDPELLNVLLKHTSRLIAQASETASPGPVLRQMLLMLPDADTLLDLPVGREVLHRFLLNPHWLDSDYKAGSPLPLSLKTLYLLQRFQHAVKTRSLNEDALLDYLQLANTKAPAEDGADMRAQANSRLAAMLEWTNSEIGLLAQRTADAHVHTVAHLDWLMRCQENARLTGLSATTLLQATDLAGYVSSSAWQQVADALIATAQ